MRSSSNIIWGLLFIAAGVILLLDNYGYVNAWYILSTYWPIILIAIGLKILWDVKRKPVERIVGESSKKDWQRSASEDAGYSSVTEDDLLKESNVMGDIEVTVKSGNFKGGYVSNVFGDTKIDLSHINAADGEHALRLSGVFGDVKIDTPHNLPIQVSGNTLAGDIAIREYKKGGFGQTISYKSSDYDTAPKKLHIDISQVFGDLKIY